MRINGNTFHVEDSNDVEVVEGFCQLVRKAELFYPSHEGSTKEIELSLILSNGEKLDFPSRVPERHRNDLSLQYRGPSNWNEIIIPGGRRWIESALATGNSQPAD